MRTQLSIYQLAMISYCADECRRQKSGELSVFWMINAYQRLAAFHDSDAVKSSLTAELIEELYTLVEPKINKRGFRVTNVILDGNVIGWQNILRQMDNLLTAQNELSPLEFYREFEEIHAGSDGTGRVGSLLFNYLVGSLEVPVAPPDVFGIDTDIGA